MSRIQQTARRVRQRTQASELTEADQIAVVNDDGITSVKVTDSDTANLIWCKLLGSDERIVQAYNGRTQVRDKLPVWLRTLADGTYEVEGIRSRDGTEFLGEALGTMNLPEIIGELLGTVWAARNLKPGRVRLSDAGGMNVYVEAFYYAGGRFSGGNLDLTAYIPATTDKQVWVVVYYDPEADALGATTGTEYDLPYLMNEIDLGAIALSPQFIRLAGITLKEGDTAVTGATVINAAQSWIDAPVNASSFWPIEITDTRTIPDNTQIAVRRQAVTGSGVLNVYGVLDIF